MIPDDGLLYATPGDGYLYAIPDDGYLYAMVMDGGSVSFYENKEALAMMLSVQSTGNCQAPFLT